LGALERGDRGLGARSERLEAGRRLVDGVAMAHPALLFVRETAQQRAPTVAEGEATPAELPGRCLLHPAAELVDHQLHAVTDAEHGDSELQQLLAECRGTIGIDRCRAAREDKPLRPPLLDALEQGVVRQQLAEHPALTDPAGYQL